MSAANPKNHRLVIAIDCDDVLLASTEFIVAAYNQQFGTNVLLKDAHASSNHQWKASSEIVQSRINSIQHSPSYTALIPSQEAQNSVHQLAKTHELHLVTARTRAVLSVTEQMIDSFFPGCFTATEHIGPHTPKGDICTRIGADVLIDDNIKHLANAGHSEGRTLIWFGDYQWQDYTIIPEGVIRAPNWRQAVIAVNRHGHQ